MEVKGKGTGHGLDVSTVRSSLQVLLARLAPLLTHGFTLQFHAMGIVH
jgi:hypothetical protein